MPKPPLRRAAFAALLLISWLPAVAGDGPRIAIIVDDLGYQLAAGRRAIELPVPLTVAILPRTPRGPALARFANRSGKEILLHLPLQPAGEYTRPDPGALLLDMNRPQLVAAFRDAMDSVPHAIGVSSHRGSLLTRHPGHMRWLMREIAARGGLFFIDSYTTAESVALQVAVESGVSATRRDVFLDNDPAPDSVRAALERLKRLARHRGQAIGICHPYPGTLEVLERELPRLADEGFELVPVSRLLPTPLNRLAEKPSNPANGA